MNTQAQKEYAAKIRKEIATSKDPYLAVVANMTDAQIWRLGQLASADE